MRVTASDRAARYAHKHRIPMSRAARRYRITRQAVAKAWKRLKLGGQPLGDQRAARRERVRNLSSKGWSARRIAAQLNITKGAVFYHLRKSKEGS